MRLSILALLASCMTLALTAGSSSAVAGGSFTGRLVDEEERPLSGMEVSLWCNGEDGPSTPEMTSSDGRFDLPARGTSCSVVTRDPRALLTTFDPLQRERVRAGEPAETRSAQHDGRRIELGDLQMRRPISIRGRILDADGRPFDRVSVRAHQVLSSTSEQTYADADGRFSFDEDVLFTGYYSLHVSTSRSDVSTDHLNTPGLGQRLVEPGQVMDVGTVRLGSRPRAPQGRVRVQRDEEVLLQSVDSFTKGYGGLRGISSVDVGRYVYAWTDATQGSTVWAGGGSRRGAPVVEVRRGETVTIPPSPRVDRFTFDPVDDEGVRPYGLSIVARATDEPVEVLHSGFTDSTGLHDFAVRRGPITVTISDPSGRYPTVRLASPRASQTIELGRSRNGVPARPEPLLRGPEPGGHLHVLARTTPRSIDVPLVVQVYDADDGDRLVFTEPWPHSPFLPKGRYKIRVSDPTGRLAPVWVGGGTSLATATTHRPYLGYPKVLSTRLVERFVPVVAPKVAGRRSVGHTLSATRGVWNGGPQRFRYQWFKGDRAIKGATTPRYTLKRSDAGRTFRVRVVAIKGSSSASARSRPVVVARG